MHNCLLHHRYIMNTEYVSSTIYFRYAKQQFVQLKVKYIFCFWCGLWIIGEIESHDITYRRSTDYAHEHSDEHLLHNKYIVLVIIKKENSKLNWVTLVFSFCLFSYTSSIICSNFIHILHWSLNMAKCPTWNEYFEYLDLDLSKNAIVEKQT